jgi:hypothetical protein
MRNIFLVIFSLLIFSACNSNKSISIYNYASPDIFIECIVNKNITSYEIIENDNGKYMEFKINSNIIIVLLKSEILRLDDYKVILINNSNNKIFKELGYNNKNIIDNYIKFIDYIFEEINVYTFTGRGEVIIYNKEYFLNRDNIIKRSLFDNNTRYIIRF